MSAAFLRSRRIALLLPLALMVLGSIVLLAHRDSALGPAPASAGGATIVVDTLADPGGPGACSLRAAIINANSNDQTGSKECVAGDGADTITFSVSGTITLSSALPPITDAQGLTINGGNSVVVSGNDSYRPFEVEESAGLTLLDIIVEKGSAPGLATGGGIRNFGTLTLDGAVVRDSAAGLGGGGVSNLGGAVTITGGSIIRNEAALGGGIANTEAGVLTLNDSTVGDNTAASGGGIFNNLEGEVAATNGTIISGNHAEGGKDADSGGGIWSDGDVTVTSSTISGNSAAVPGNGGGIRNEGDLTVTNGTISGNSAAFGGGIRNGFAGSVTVINSTISGNSGFFIGGGIDTRGDLTVTSSTISGNSSANEGGGISNGGSVTVTNSTISGNSTLFGGGIRNGFAGSVTVINSTISENAAADGLGGGIDNGGSVTVTNSTISGNSALFGGGIRNFGDLTVTNSTISGNSSADEGGGIWNEGDLTVTNGTITANAAANEGGGIYNDGGTVNLTNTIVAGQNFRDDCEGTAPTSGGHNLDSDGTCNLTAAGDLPNRDANLGPLADNGGPTLTHALLEGSDAIDAGDDAVCADEPVNGVDQRGAFRPAGKACDIGAFEFGAVIPLWGDIDCDGAVVIGDALKTARYLLSLSVSQEAGCPEPGVEVTVNGVDRTWGDVDCDESVAIGDALKIARWLLGLSVSQEEGCPEVGTEIVIGS